MSKKKQDKPKPIPKLTKDDLAPMLEFLRRCVPENNEYTPVWADGFFRVLKGFINMDTGKQFSGAYCFVAMHDHDSRVGRVKKGDIFWPENWANPQRDSFGTIYDPETWVEFLRRRQA